MLIIVLLASLFLSLAALAADLVYAYVVKSRTVTAIDAAALGAVRNVGQGTAEMNKTIEMLFKANFPNDFMLTNGSAPGGDHSGARRQTDRNLVRGAFAYFLHAHSRLRRASPAGVGDRSA